jgi:hypothetical protein
VLMQSGKIRASGFFAAPQCATFAVLEQMTTSSSLASARCGTHRHRKETDVEQQRHATGRGRGPPGDLKALGDRLVGTWTVSGEAEGETNWEWMEGGFFLIQRGWTRREGTEQTFLQIIGYDRMPSSEPADAITGRLYTSHGDTLAYVCEL